MNLYQRNSKSLMINILLKLWRYNFKDKARYRTLNEGLCLNLAASFYELNALRLRLIV